MNIQKKMIHIWIGPKNPPLQWMNTWKEKHPDWEYRIFDNEELARVKSSFVNERILDIYLKAGKYNGAADIIRYEMLYKEGGFFPPADAICLENTDELWNMPEEYCYGVYENEQIVPGNISPIYACNPGNSFLKTIIDRISCIHSYDVRGPATTTGNWFLKSLLEQVRPNNIKIFPSHYFIPKHFRTNKRYEGKDKVYADQMWGSTKKIY